MEGMDSYTLYTHSESGSDPPIHSGGLFVWILNLSSVTPVPVVKYTKHLPDEMLKKSVGLLKMDCTGVSITPTAESLYPGILDTEILRVKDRFCRYFSGVWNKKIQELLTC